jgi:hypothetical protein
MAEFYFWIFCALIVAAFIRIVAKPMRIYQYPYFMAAAFTIFILPQAISLLGFPGPTSSTAVEATLFMACLCLAMSLLAGAFPVSRWIVAKAIYAVREDRLLQAGIALTAVGYVASFFMVAAAAELESGPWTGRVTVYLFFASLVIPGFAIALRSAFARGGLVSWICAGVAAWPSVNAVVFHGRRETAVELLIVVGMTLFYQRRLSPPRSLIIGAIVFAMLFIPATGAYRSMAASAGLGAMAQLDLVGNFESFLNGGAILELRNAAMAIDVTSLLGTYEFGTGYWNELVWRFVPAQFVGTDVKQWLTIQLYDQTLEYNLWRMSYIAPTGTTVTGIGDAFVQFGYYGCLFFLIIGIGTRSLWVASLRPDGAFAQLLYICTMTSAMRAITHQTVDYLPGLVFYIIFLGLAVWYARDTTKRHPARRQRALHVAVFLGSRIPFVSARLPRFKGE